MWTAVLVVHVLAMSLFVGGQMFLAIAVVPLLRRDPEALPMREIGRRFGIASGVALLLLIATGSALASHNGDWSKGVLHAKLTLVVAVIAMTLMHLRKPRAVVLDVAILMCSLAIVTLGVVLAN